MAPFTPGAFKWTYHAFWGIQDLANVQLNMWDTLKTNKKVGVMWPNDADGQSDADPKTGLRVYYNPDGYSVVDGGRFQNGSEDFTTQISKFKAAGCDIVSGVMIPPDFTNFWKQCFQQGFKPMAITMAKALLFPSALEALGKIGYGLSSEVWWSPSHPFTSSLTGQTCQQLADAYESSTGKQWTQPIMHYEVFEVVVDALKRTTNVDDKQVIVDADQGHRPPDHRRPHHAGRRARRSTRATTCASRRSPAVSGTRAPSTPSTSTSSTAPGPRSSSASTSRPRPSSRPSRTDPSVPALEARSGSPRWPSAGLPSGVARAAWGGARRLAPPHVSSCDDFRARRRASSASCSAVLRRMTE